MKLKARSGAFGWGRRHGRDLGFAGSAELKNEGHGDHPNDQPFWREKLVQVCVAHDSGYRRGCESIIGALGAGAIGPPA